VNVGLLMQPRESLHMVRFKQSQPGFVNESSRLKRMSRSLLGDFVSSQFSQFLIKDRQQLLRRRSISVLEIVKDVRQIAHAQIINQSAAMWNNIAHLQIWCAFEARSGFQPAARMPVIL
jgi:hypothetical protein